MHAYLNLKIPGPTGIITVEAKAQHVLNCEQHSIELATAAVVTAESRQLSLQAPSASPSPVMPPSSNTFKAAEDSKTMKIDAKDPAKTIQIRVGLNPK
jgi:hypothetical protein